MFSVKPYTESHNGEWDKFIDNCPSATFLHSRKFLAYHQDRFSDTSLMIYKEDTLVGVLPAALDPHDQFTVVSHPGITYGGLLTTLKIHAGHQIEMMKQILEHYQSLGLKHFIYKAVPDCFKSRLMQDDAYVLFFHKATLIRRDLNCVIELEKPNILSNTALSKLRNMFRKSEKNAVQLQTENTRITDFYTLLTQTLAQHQQKPVHSLSELEFLLSQFPHNIKLYLATHEEQVIAGALLFLDAHFVHTQYLASSAKGHSLFALDFLINQAINTAKQEQKSFFSFGISNEQQGRHLNLGLYSSKVKHGGVGITHDYYAIQL